MKTKWKRPNMFNKKNKLIRLCMELLRRECLAISLMKKPEYPINIILQ